MNKIQERANKPIYTLRDFKRDQEHADYLRERRERIKFLKQKVKYWQAKYERFGGEVHLITLGRFQDELKQLQEQK